MVKYPTCWHSLKTLLPSINWATVKVKKKEMADVWWMVEKESFLNTPIIIKLAEEISSKKRDQKPTRASVKVVIVNMPNIIPLMITPQLKKGLKTPKSLRELDNQL